MKTLTDHLSCLPPFVCRLLAKKKGARGYDLLTNRDIARLSGLSLRTVIRLSQRNSWAGVKIGVADRYMSACGVNPLRLSTHVGQLKRIFNSRNGLEGTWHLHRSKRLPIWRKAARAKHMKKLVKLLS